VPDGNRQRRQPILLTANATVPVWLGARRGTDRGEGSSGLAFDLLANTETG